MTRERPLSESASICEAGRRPCGCIFSPNQHSAPTRLSGVGRRTDRQGAPHVDSLRMSDSRTVSSFGFLVLATLLAGPGTGLAQEPVIGGPCEGCELVFAGMPAKVTSRSRIGERSSGGEALIIEGTVRTGNGTPAEGIIVYAYQTNANGVYPSGMTRHGTLRGWARTDQRGNYRFDTIRPGAYPERSTTQHVHMHVIEPGKATYYIDDIVFSDDPLLTAAQRRAMLRGRGGDGLCDPLKDESGVWRVRRDITLGKSIPGYDDVQPDQAAATTGNAPRRLNTHELVCCPRSSRRQFGAYFRRQRGVRRSNTGRLARLHNKAGGQKAPELTAATFRTAHWHPGRVDLLSGDCYDSESSIASIQQATV